MALAIVAAGAPDRIAYQSVKRDNSNNKNMKMIIDTKQAKRTNESTTKIMSERRGGIQSFVIVDIGRRRSLLTSWTEHLHKYV